MTKTIHETRELLDGRTQRRSWNKKGKKWNQWKSLCSMDGCDKFAQDTSKLRGLCRAHGAELKMCKSIGCTKKIQQGGFCRRHGASLKLCSRKGCSNICVKNDVCLKHGAVVSKCIISGCEKYRQRNKMCMYHYYRDNNTTH